ncbi:hypothetical protein Xen7305DRAFT_00024260 [Xenococcus sp. PCC 7305]|uniref:hypothetical protein n=1 Tax=Xenococcus sp. PCC 7305 TaxID=102125 RepID=UPI0002AC26FB|nr:hypothetical protein [Xenococcus sp. PCC 7305]ELS02708.1 hypothetical protein Xen7305DRAFT_00024260 [Xenococcus sp. PCC 7305]
MFSQDSDSQYQENIQAQLIERIQAINKKAPEYFNAVKQAKKCESDLEEKQKIRKQFQDISPQQKLFYFLIPPLLLCVYIINLLLISDATEYLVRRRFGDTQWSNLFVLIVPLVLIFFEIFLAAFNLYVQENAAFRKQYPAAKSLQFLVHLIVLVTPILLFATKFAEYATKNRLPYPHEALLILALTFLAWITDAAVVYGIKFITQAMIFFSSGLTPKRTEKKSVYWSNQTRKELQFIGDDYETYKPNLQEYDKRYPEDPLILPPFSQEAKQAIVIYLGCDPKDVL